MVTGKNKGDGNDFNSYSFDQEARHTALFNYIRDGNWEAVTSFFDKKSVLYHDDRVLLKRWRVVDHLEAIFGNIYINFNRGLILQSPFIFKPGVTKSSAMIEVGFSVFGTFLISDIN